MGANMVRRLQRGGHECVAYDVNAETVAAIAATGVDRVSTGWPTHDAPWLDVALDWK